MLNGSSFKQNITAIQKNSGCYCGGYERLVTTLAAGISPEYSVTGQKSNPAAKTGGGNMKLNVSTRMTQCSIEVEVVDPRDQHRWGKIIILPSGRIVYRLAGRLSPGGQVVDTAARSLVEARDILAEFFGQDGYDTLICSPAEQDRRI